MARKAIFRYSMSGMLWAMLTVHLAMSGLPRLPSIRYNICHRSTVFGEAA